MYDVGFVFLYNAGYHLGSTSDAEMLQRMQAMEDTHGVSIQQTVMSHSNELEKSTSSLHDLQCEPQMNPVSVL